MGVFLTPAPDVLRSVCTASTSTKNLSRGGIHITEIKHCNYASPWDRLSALAGGGREGLDTGLDTGRQVGPVTFLHLISFCFASEWENGSVQKADFAFFKVMKFYLGLHNSKESKWIFDESLWTGKAKFFKPWSPDTYPFSLSLSIYLPQRNVVFLFCFVF